MKQSFVQKYPHKVVVPKNATSPTGSVYQLYDIVSQGMVLWRDGRTVRSARPFILRVQVGKKTKTLLSKVGR